MPQKKKTQKTKKLGIDPTLKPRVVRTKSPLTEEEQNENPLGRMKKNNPVADRTMGIRMKLIPDMTQDAPLPQGFKTADSLTEVDDLKFENGRLREMLASWLDRLMIEGVAYQVMVDPMNRVVQINREKYAGV